MSQPLRLALIGLGNIGGLVCDIAGRSPQRVHVVGALVRDPAKPRAAATVPQVTTAPELLALQPEVVIECGGRDALREHGPAVLLAGHDLVPSSLGLFAEDAQMERFSQASLQGRGRMRLCNGAVGAIDALLGAREIGLDEVRYRFVMSPRAWSHAVDPSAPQGRSADERIVYQGSAREAARQYPRHANLTATIALAGIGFERTQVELVVDSEAVDNRHDLEASGKFGKLSVSVQGKHISSTSPSSRLVAGSLLAAAVSGAPTLF